MVAKKKISKASRRNVGEELNDARNQISHLKGVLEEEREKSREQALRASEWYQKWGEQVILSSNMEKDCSKRLKRAQSLIDEQDLNISVLVGEIARLRNQLQQSSSLTIE